ncbi:hypothetical protein V9T40_002762 [Parthenolecanium corni]|uniref:Mothers against decapentaplegic homolog n=1 Tax=Parthenolecanium corni TaxID=536013 RepID=A0AAN9TL04_9HEMI
MDSDDGESKSSGFKPFSAFSNMFMKLHPAFKVVSRWKQGDEEEKWAEKAVEALIKKLKKNKASYEELMRAITYPQIPSQCVTIPRSLDGRLQVSHRKGLPHVIYCRVFRWPDLQSHHELKPMEHCRHPFTPKQKDVCINPYHYKRVEHAGSMPPVVVPRYSEFAPQQATMQLQQQQQRQQQNYVYGGQSSSYSSGMMSPASSSGAGGQSPYQMNFMDDSQPCSPFAEYGINFSEASSAQYQDPQEHWGTIAYYELNSRVGEAFQCYSSRVIVDGFTNPGREINRFCLGQLTNVNRNSTIENTRRHIGKGIELCYDRGSLILKCLSEKSVYVHSWNCNMNLGIPLTNVIKLPSGHSLNIFDVNKFVELLGLKASEGFEAAYELTKMCTIRMSLVKGWGSDYHRQDITSTPCWLEIHMNGALKWLDQILTKMTAPETAAITSVS